MRDSDFNWQELRGVPALALASFDRFYGAERTYDALRPTPEIMSRVDETAARFDNTIGVHVRRGDNDWSRDGSPTDLFIKRMKTAIAEDETTTFFLATDDPSVEDAMVAEFPGRIIIYPKRSLDRRSPLGIKDAAIDLYSLAATRLLIGSYFSTFSIVASEIGGVPIEIIERPGRREKGARWYVPFDKVERPGRPT